LLIFIISKNLAEHWDLPNTGIFYSKDVASETEPEAKSVNPNIQQNFSYEKYG
jgi:hypothetical protein